MKQNCRKLFLALSSVVDFFDYNIWRPVKEAYLNMVWFFRNVKTFWKTLIHFRNWDYQYCVDLFIVGLTQLADCIENGCEDKRSSKKKAASIRKLIAELQRDVWDEACKKYHAGEIPESDIFLTEDKLGDERFDNAVRLIRGQNEKQLAKKQEEAINKWKLEHPGEQINRDVTYSIYVDLFDGSGYKGWWE